MDCVLDTEIENEIDNQNDSSGNNTRDCEQWFTADDKRKANPLKHPACVGCSNYHGHSYGGNLLVCAMHPYGWKNENCPDWETEV